MSDNFHHRNLCSIVGIGSTDFSRASGRSVITLATQAARAAIEDAGLPVSAIDGIVRCDHDLVSHNDLGHSLGLSNLTYWGGTGTGGGAPCGMIGQAVGAVISGQAENVLVFRSLNGRSGARYGQGNGRGETLVGGTGTYDEYFLPYGLSTPGQMWALIAKRHMIEFGTTSEHLGHIAMACRARANANPAAQMRDRKMSMEDYLDSPYISQPLRLFDYCLETDGACAVIVSRTDRAGDLPGKSCVIRAVAQGAHKGMQPGVTMPALMRTELTTQPSADVARTLYRRAEMEPSDVQVAQFYDCFTPTILVQLEDYGFCAKGEGGQFAASGALEMSGSLPINTAGGNLSEGYIHGMNHIVEGVRQIRGESTSQVPNASICLVTSGLPIVTSGMILTAGAL
jgi:acetyl-CoA acetyltransferase